MASSTDKYLLAAAFDFGTTYSGYAFSFRDDPLKVQTNQNWVAGSEKLISLKTPTCVLLDPDKNFDSFGFQAENKYADLAEDGKHHGWLFFSRFKMLLHNNEALSRTTMIEDINGKKMSAKIIFAMSIRYLRDHLLKALNTQTTGIEETDILYVLTVPAIWDDSAKQFMREAAIEAGIDTARLKLALEPEAASIWCQTVTTEAKAAMAGSGTRYMVVDLGGGTADITVHEKQKDGTLKELHKASGGPWGGTYVDNNFLEWLKQVFGSKAFERFKKEDMADFIYMLRGFESIKRTTTVDSKDQVTFRIPATLKEKSDKEAGAGNSLENRLKSLNLSESVTVKSDKMRIKPDIVRSWFKKPLDAVIDHVKKILDEPQMLGVNTILLVGGFGESQYVHEQFKATFKTKTIIVPADAGLVVLKGAVRFGHEPAIVSSRVIQHTYGYASMRAFDETQHPADKMVLLNGRKKIGDCFSIFVSAGETFAVGHEVKYSATPNYMDESTIYVFSSTEAKPLFTTDASCKKLGLLLVKHPEGSTLEEKSFDVIFVFGETELVVKARIHKTGKEFNTSIDCLK